MSDKDKKEWGNAYKKELSKVDSSSTQLNCSAAISNTTWQLDTMLTQGKRNLNNGSITQAQYTQAAAEVQKAKGLILYSSCQTATGLERSFYECMSSDRNHLVGCATKFNFLDF